MDRTVLPTGDGAVEAVLERAGALTIDELVRLAAAWRGPDREGRTRTLELAVARASAQAEVRRLRARAATIVHGAASRRAADGADLWRLRQLDVLWPAQMAVADAAVAALVADRLAPDVAERLTAAWRSVA